MFRIATYGNDTEPANEPVDPAAEQNQTDSSGQDVDEFRLLCEFWTSA